MDNMATFLLSLSETVDGIFGISLFNGNDLVSGVCLLTKVNKIIIGHSNRCIECDLSLVSNKTSVKLKPLSKLNAKKTIDKSVFILDSDWNDILKNIIMELKIPVNNIIKSNGLSNKLAKVLILEGDVALYPSFFNHFEISPLIAIYSCMQ